MRRVSVILAAAAAEYLDGVEVVGREVRSDADMAMAADQGFTVEAIDALRKRGATDREIGDLIIKPRTLSHRRANRSNLTVEESDRAARVAWAFALAEKTFANRDKADCWLHKNLNSLGRPNPHGTHLDRRRRPHRGESHGADLLGRARLMRMWRLSGADDAERFDGGFGLHHDGRWNSRGRPMTYCATGPALCVLEKLVRIEDVRLLPDDLRVEEADLDGLPEDWRTDEPLTRSIGDAWLDGVSACLLCIPSVIVPIPDADDRNIIVNHRHGDAARIAISSIERFAYDPRQFGFE